MLKIGQNVPGTLQPRIEDWTDWKRQCARALCGKETQARLGRFAQSRFGIQLRRQLGATNLNAGDASQQLPSPDDAWHQFESYAAITHTREGKRYKDWIFARVRHADDTPLNVVQSGATLIMRGVVRTHLRQEYARHSTVSFDQPVGDGSITVGDLLPGSTNPVDGVAAEEYAELAQHHAKRIFDSLSPRERIGLFAKYRGIRLDDAEILAAAGCGKSTLNQAIRDLLLRMREEFTREYEDDGPDAIMAFSALVLQQLEVEIFLWKKSEQDAPQCFY